MDHPQHAPVAPSPTPSPNPPGRGGWVVFLAQGFGIGRIPWAPGTFGSVLGIAWFALLLMPGNPLLFLLGNVAGIAVAVWATGRAEILMGRHDPSSVVLDEIIALPLCFAALLLSQSMRHGFPDFQTFIDAWSWWVLPGGFLAFRFFDIFKPWPVGPAQALPGGWGVVTDDLLAALWVSVVSLALVAAV